MMLEFLSLFKSHGFEKKVKVFLKFFRKKKENSLERTKQGSILNQSNQKSYKETYFIDIFLFLILHHCSRDKTICSPNFYFPLSVQTGSLIFLASS